MRRSRRYIAMLLLLSLVSCDTHTPTVPPDTPEIVSFPSNAKVDEEVLLVLIARDEDDFVTIEIDWGDGRGLDVHHSVETAFQVTISYSYLDAGTYTMQCRAVNASGRISAWSPEKEIRIGGTPLLGQGDWYTFMRDSKRSGYSPYAGPATPVLTWKYRTVSPVRSSAVFDLAGTMHFGSDDFHLRAVYRDGRKKWQYRIGLGNIRSTPFLDDNGNAYFGSNSANVYCVDRIGLRTWSVSVNSPIGTSSAVLTRSGLIVIGCLDGRVYAFDTAGNSRWMYITGGPIEGSPAVGDDGTLYITSTDKLLYALSSDGTLKWTFPTGGQLRGSPTITPDGTILVCSDDGYLYALRSDAALRWKKNLHAPLHGTAAVTPEGRILCVTTRGDIVSVDEHGDEEWRTSFALVSTFSNAIVDVNGSVYVGGPDGMLSAFGRYGNLLWRFETGGPINSTPSIAQDGSIAVGSDDGYMYLIGER